MTKIKTVKKKKLPIWDETRKLYVYRKPPIAPFYTVERIDPGVNYFVLMLEQLGAMPLFSCEGHPQGFYVMFECPQKLAERIHMCGFFTVELEGHNRWSIRTRPVDSDAERKQLLRWAAISWEATLGPLNLKNANAQKIKAKKVAHA